MSKQKKPEQTVIRTQDWDDQPASETFTVTMRDEFDGELKTRNMDFYRYACAMQMPDPTFIEMIADTNRYVTGLIVSGHVTPWEALRVGEAAVRTPEGWRLGEYTEYTFDEQGREGIRFPDAQGMAERLRDIYPNREIPGPEDMQVHPPLSGQVIVHDQEELDRVPADYAGRVVIDSRGSETIQLAHAYAMPVQVTGSSKVEVQGDSHVEAQGYSRVSAWENSVVTAREYSSVLCGDRSRVEAWADSHVEAWDSSEVTAHEHSVVRADGRSSVVALDKCRVYCGENSRVTAHGESQVRAFGDSHVEAWGSSQVTAWGRSTVEAHDQSRVEPHPDRPAMDRAAVWERFSQAQGGDIPGPGSLTGPDRTDQAGDPAQKLSVKERLRQIAGQIAQAAPHRGQDARQR